MNDYIQLWYDKYETEARTLMHDIWEHPEFAMEEYYTAGRLAGFTGVFHTEPCSSVRLCGISSHF